MKFEYGFDSVNGIVKKKYYLHEIPNIKEKCDVWNVLPIVYVRQFTGLLDINGIEIYEKDAIKTKWSNHSKVDFYVKFINGTWGLVDNYDNPLETHHLYNSVYFEYLIS